MKAKATLKATRVVEIDLKQLERIAEYYEFPMAVFFSTKVVFKARTRREALFKKAEKLDKIKEILDEE